MTRKQLCLVLLLASKSTFAAQLVDRVEASINQSTILHSEVMDFRKNSTLRNQLDPLFQGTPLAKNALNAPLEKIVDFLIEEKIIQLQFPVSDLEVEQEINSIQAANRIDRSSLKRALEEQGHRFEDYFELIRLSASKRNLIDRDIRTKVLISDDDVRNFYQNHYSGQKPLQRAYRIQAIFINPRNYISAQAAREVAERARLTILNGEDFTEVAKRVSEDSSATSGGDLGLLTDSQMSAIIRDQIHKMRVGELSPVFGTPQTSFMFLMLNAIEDAEDDETKKILDDIRMQLSTGEYQRQISLWLERQKQGLFIHRFGEDSLLPYQKK
jgi:peptidyl-prolyl cis-trans isomerase SurA